MSGTPVVEEGVMLLIVEPVTHTGTPYCAGEPEVETLPLPAVVQASAEPFQYRTPVV